MNKRAPLITAAVAMAALAGWLLFPHGERGQRPRATPASAQDDNAAELASLHERVAFLEREARKTPSSTPRVESSAVASASPVEQAAPAPRRGVTGDEAYQGLEQHFKAEVKDPAWSAQTEASIQSALHGPAFAGSTVLSAQCAATLCRVDIAHDSGVAQDSFLGTVRTTPPFDGGGLAHRVVDPDTNAVRTVVYMAREGYDLPWPSAQGG